MFLCVCIKMHKNRLINPNLLTILDLLKNVVLIISKSGESPEIKVLVTLIKNFGNTLIGMAGNTTSFLAKNADIVLNTTVEQEACPNNRNVVCKTIE